MSINQRLTAFLLFFLISGNLFSMDDARLMRYPDINNQLVAFVYAGDIWTVDADGGQARRLTSHEGLELFPKISPDGKWIAFSAEYSGSRQIWIMPAEGGAAKQLTYYNSVGVMPPRGGFDNVVLGWTKDSQKILIRANRTEFGERNGKYFMVDINGGFEKPLQIVNGGFAALSPDENKICFTPVDREFRTWKRYKGGRASDLWIYDLQNNISEQITDFKGSDQWPIWESDGIYYASDQDLRLNIYRYDLQTKQNKQLTFFKDYDVMWPSGRNGKIVFENGGWLYVLDTKSGENKKISVSLDFDNPNLHAYYKNVKDDINSFNVSPTGKRALFDARGDIFSVPAENGNIINLTNTQGVREIYPSWSPDGKYIAHMSDATGEYEIYLLENKEGAKARQLTSGSTAWKYEVEWSPDSRFLLYSDRTLYLKLLEVSTGKETQIDKATSSEISSYTFSPDSKWVVYDKESPNGQAAIWVYDITTEKATQLTNDDFDDRNAAFSRDGKFLFFVSNRDFNLDFSSFEFDYLYNEAARIYAVALQNDGTRLVPVKVDTEPVQAEPAEDKGKKKEKSKDDAAPKEDKITVRIDFGGINSRIEAVSEKSGNYRIIAGVDGGLLYASEGKIWRYNIEDQKSEEILDRTYRVVPTADGKSMIYQSGGNYGIAKINPGQKPDAGKLDLDKLEMKIDPRAEWNQIYTEGWRIFRDWFYVNNMHGVDWKKMHDNYAAILPYVGSRFDLDYLLCELVSETNVGHAYVNWGDIKRPKMVSSGLLGAAIEADGDRYRIMKIYEGENWNPTRRSPLTEAGVDVKEGDYIISIDGVELKTDTNPYALLENKANTDVELVVSSKADGTAPRKSTVKTIDSELELMNFNWVNERRALVDKLSDGKIGYIYVPNTSFEGNRELYRGMYTYHNKEALIIDDRYNGGGFIPDRMADLLDRHNLSFWYRNGMTPAKVPGIAHTGPKVMLINGYSSSGGDAFPYFFKKLKLGKLIGTRTWGGLVGISGNAGLVDGGSISVPQFGIFDEHENWIIEGIGVYPDIEVVDRPEQLAKGEDPCIEKAVEELLKELQAHPVKQINAPAPPDRSQWHEQEIK